jgi:hypothetical protein
MPAVIRSCLLVLAVGGVLALAGPARAAPSFDFSPTQPLTNEVITFTAVEPVGPVTWDFDGDQTCDPAPAGNTVTHSFATSGQYVVTMCTGPVDKVIRGVTVINRGPAAGFTISPAEPVTRQAIVLSSTSVDPDGPIVSWAWDLNNDGVFGEGSDETALFLASRPGSYPVALRVTDRDGASAVAQSAVVVAQRPPGQLSPQPVVRVVGDPTRFGARLTLLTVSAPKGAHVGVRCKGRNCPYKRKRFVAKGGRTSLRALRRRFRAGTVIEVRVTKPETIGHLTRLRIRAGDRPARLDRCLRPGKPEKPLGCDSI